MNAVLVPSREPHRLYNKRKRERDKKENSSRATSMRISALGLKSMVSEDRVEGGSVGRPGGGNKSSSLEKENRKI